MVGIISFVVKYWKFIVAGICFVGSVGVGFYISNKMWQGKYEILKAQYNGCQTSLNMCMSANEENVITVERLRKELKQQQLLCEQRVRYYKELIKQVQEVDSLTGGKDEKGVINCPDDVCVMLNGMWR